MTALTIPTADLRAALSAVAPHADPDNGFPPLHRIRITVTPDDTTNAAVTATNRYTAGHALVDIEDADLDTPWHVDLSPADVKEILTLFKTPKNGDDEQPDNTLRLNVTDAHTTITDTSGLFEGKSLRLPRYPTEDNFPDVPRLIGNALTRPPHGATRLATDGAKLVLFNAAAKAYAQPLFLEPTGENAAIVVSCGEAFLGLLMPLRQDDADYQAAANHAAAWVRRLGLATTGAGE